MRRSLWVWTAVMVWVVFDVGAAQAQWSNAQLFNDPSEAGMDVKNAGIFAARGGGFHGIYFRNNGSIRYRRYSNGVLGGRVSVWDGGQCFNGKVTESLNAEIHVVFEDWSAGPNNIRWFKSSNGGASFPVTQLLTTADCAKHPQIAAYGMGETGDLVMSYLRSGTSCDESLWSRRYDGASWAAEVPLGSYSLGEFDCFGMARSPLDGSIYRTFDPNQTTMLMRRYTGTWGGEIPLVSGSWPVRQHMAVNDGGQIMLVWDNTSHIFSQIYTPGIGAGTPQDLGQGGYSGACDVCAIPGTNDFYMVVGRDLGGGNYHVYGRKYTAGGWQAEESVMNGQANDFLVTPVVTADVTGKVYCIWEYWGTDKPQQWYAVRDGGLPPGPKGYVAGTVRDSFGAPLLNASISIAGMGSTMTAANGTYSLQSLTGTRNVDCYKTFYAGQTANNVVIADGGTTTVNFTLTSPLPSQIASLTVVSGNRNNVLSWTCPSSASFNGAMVRYSTSDYPTSPTDGTYLADVAGLPGQTGTYTHSGLTNGTEYYYSVFAYFQDASRYYATGRASDTGTPFGPGDMDHDGDVDQSDFGVFQACLTGDLNPQTDPACQAARFDIDADVDQTDLEAWQMCYSGPNVPANPLCGG